MNILTSIECHCFKVVHLTTIHHLYVFFYKTVEIVAFLHFKVDGHRQLDGKEGC